MLLDRLVDYATRRALPPRLYDELPVRYIIELDAKGRLLNREPLDTADPSNRGTRRGQPRLVPNVQRSVGIKPLLLADKADYTLGYAGEKGKPERVALVHQRYMEQLARCLEETKEPALHAVQTFLENDPLGQLDLGDKFDPGEKIIFRVDGTFPTDLESVQGYWAVENTDPNAPVMQCVVCGEERPVLERLEGKIKGILGGQSTGTSIISANADAFESYGLSASLVAPTCAACGEKFTKAANRLLASGQEHIRLGEAEFIFWTREEVPFSFRDLLYDPQPEQVRDLYASVRSGGRRPEVDDVAFYATNLSGSGGRAVVRDWIDTTVGEAKARLDRWFRLQRIVGPYGEEAPPLGLRDLASATVRDLKDLPTPTSRELLRAALAGTPLPMDLLSRAVRRNAAERSVVPPRTPSRYAHKRMALIKMVLMSHEENQEEEYMVRLDHDNPSAAYRCGRLLAVLEAAQKLAIRGINATIVDRYYGTASSAPASVFGNLLDGARSHLSKLARERPGAHAALQKRIEEIMGGISGTTGFPRTLTQEQQGLFALGYYHQRAWDRAQQIEAKRRREAGEPPAAVAEPDLQLGLALEESEEAAVAGGGGERTS